MGQKAEENRNFKGANNNVPFQIAWQTQKDEKHAS